MQRGGIASLEPLADAGGGLALVCDVGGGTTDLTLIHVARDAQGALELSRVAVGRHLLLGGDNMDLALAHLCEEKLVKRPDRLDAQRFAQLVLACAPPGTLVP
jgi:molecular chaperone DnaK (HSP70)